MSIATKVLLDSDILSLYFKKDPLVLSAAQDYLLDNFFFTFSIITRFEILRGLKARNASRQMIAFDSFCKNNEILELDDAVVVRAADIYSTLHKTGQLVGDADILIAATALEHNLPLVTNNQNHFNRISGLQLLNWAV